MTSATCSPLFLLINGFKVKRGNDLFQTTSTAVFLNLFAWSTSVPDFILDCDKVAIGPCYGSIESNSRKYVWLFKICNNVALKSFKSNTKLIFALTSGTGTLISQFNTSLSEPQRLEPGKRAWIEKHAPCDNWVGSSPSATVWKYSWICW